MPRFNSFLALACALIVAACDGHADDGRIVGELASDRMALAAENSEPIVEIVVDEGTDVRQGDALIRQDDSRAKARLAEADAALAEAEARLDELVQGPRREQIDAARADLEGAEHDLEFRVAEHDRAQELEAQQLASPQNLDRATANLDAARATLEARQARLDELLAGTRVEELAQAESMVRQAEARLDAARIDVERHTIRAPVDGITDARLYELGERPVPGQPVVVVLGGKQPYARVFVPESVRVHVASGTRARVFVDGITDPIDGRVRWVATEAAFTPYFALTEHDRSRLSFVAKIDLLGVDERLPDGVPVEVELDLGMSGRQ